MATEPKDRIVITGVGVVAPNGIGKEEFWTNCAAGVSGIKRITLFDTSKYRCHWAGEISDFDPAKYLGPKGLRNLDRTTLLALVAAKLAIEDAQLEITDDNRNEIGVVLGSTMGSVHSISEFDKEGLREGPRYVNPAKFPNTVINSPASQVAIRFGLKGLNATLSTGFTASLDAVGYALDMLRLGRAQTLLVGGVEELCIETFLGFYKLGMLATSPNGTIPRWGPHQERSCGTLLGEGAAFFVLEPFEWARERCARILADLPGYGTRFDGATLRPSEAQSVGLAEAVREALSASGVGPDDVAAVSGCANGTHALDEVERQALEGLRLGLGHEIALTNVKSAIGESFSAAGAFQLLDALGTLAGQRTAPESVPALASVGASRGAAKQAGRPGTRSQVAVAMGSGPTGVSSAVVLAANGER
jgi:3-oxoacyl-[acyl-carrier-protein] synthase II